VRPLKHYWHPNDVDRSETCEIVQTLEVRLVAYADQTLVGETDREVSSMRVADREARRRHLVRDHMHQEWEVSRTEALVGSHAVVQRAMQEVRSDSVAVRTRSD